MNSGRRMIVRYAHLRRRPAVSPCRAHILGARAGPRSLRRRGPPRHLPRASGGRGVAVAFIACSVLGDRKGEPGSAIEQPVDVGPTVVGGIGGLITEACDTATQMVDVPVEYGNIGAVVAVVVPRALND